MQNLSNSNTKPSDFDVYSHSFTKSFDILTQFEPNLFQRSNIIPKTFFTELFVNTENESIIFLLSLIRDKSYQLYIDFTKPLESNLKIAKEIAQSNTKIFPGHDCCIDEVWKSYTNELSSHIKAYVLYARELPGFNKMDVDDFSAILNDSIPPIFGLKITKFFIDDECYLLIDHIQLSRKWMNLLIGKNVSDIIFEFHNKLHSLNITNQELALIFPYVLTSAGKS